MVGHRDPPMGNKGREHAIEAIMDMDPRGALFRAKRIMDEASPSALLARPNRITTAALLDAAQSLSCHEITSYTDRGIFVSTTADKRPKHGIGTADTASFDGASEEVESPRRTLAFDENDVVPSVSEEERDRILRHHAKLIIAKNNASRARVGPVVETSSPTLTGTSAAVPPPQLVAALRRVYGSSSSDRLAELSEGETVSDECNVPSPIVLLPSLLKSVMSHRTFAGTDHPSRSSAETSASTEAEEKENFVAGKSLANESSELHDADGEAKKKEADIEAAAPPAAANMEIMLGNVCRVAAAGGASDSDGDDSDALQGLLIAALSVLTSCIIDTEEEDTEREYAEEYRKDKETSCKLPTSTTGDVFDRAMPLLQVGGVLSLLRSLCAAPDAVLVEDRSFELDDEILSYLGKAAATYEERIEIQKARLLAKMEAKRLQEEAAEQERKEKDEGTVAACGEDATTDASSGPLPVAPLSPLVPETPVASEVQLEETPNAPETQGDEPASIPIARHVSEESVAAEDSGHLETVDSTLSSNTGDAVHSANVVENSQAVESSTSGHDDEQKSEHDSAGGEEDDNDSATTVGYEGAIGLGDGENPSGTEPHSSQMQLDSTRGHYAPDDEIDLDDDDSSSSSSSSSSSGDPEDILGEDDDDDDDDDEVESDDDEEDDAMLARALALSLAEHSAALAALGLGAGETQMSEGNERSALDEAPLASAEGANATAETQGGDAENGKSNMEAGSSAPPLDESSAPESSTRVSSDDGDEQFLLPPLPAPPARLPYLSMMQPNVGSVLGRGQEPDFSSFESSALDPGALSNFGLLPSSHVLVYLLLCAVGTTQRRISSKQNALQKNKKNAATSSPGGVGSFLFPSDYRAKPSKEGFSKRDSSGLSADMVSLHLLIASFVLLSDARTEALEKLRQAVQSEHKRLIDENENRQQEGEDEGTPLPDEDDDPAFAAAAMKYLGVKKTVAPTSSSVSSSSSSSTSQSLETKGMKRKAAAAAHVAAVRLESLRKRTAALNDRVRLYSACLLVVMRSIRLSVFEKTERKLTKDYTVVTDENSTTNDAEGLELPLPTRLNLVSAFDALMSSSASHAQRELIDFLERSSFLTEDEAGKHEGICLRLYQEAMLTWSECIPIIYPSHEEREDVLRLLVQACFFDCEGNLVNSFSTAGIKSLPWSEQQERYHRLIVLCQRLRVSDTLDGFVSEPLVFDAEDNGKKETCSDACLQSDSGSKSVHSRKDELKDSLKQPIKTSSIISLLGSVAVKFGRELGDRNDFVSLYLALCHRCNVNLLLWDRVLSTPLSDDPINDEILSLSATSPVSAGDAIRVSSTPSDSLQFDSTKCADSIAIIPNNGGSASSPNGPSANQRASKVWGTVLSTTFFSPKTGVHRWAVRLDRCERGHVFVGVATAQATVKTYVGGDKYGYGLIGTQALWHDRGKIRGDYGATFRTGATIIVTLDTDAGTLSFGLWKDPALPTTTSSTDSLSSSQSLNLSSPTRRVGLGSGSVEDWGIAFEGLPLDAKLFPAVGLYQRDDRVTLLSVTSASRGSIRNSALNGECYFPRLTVPASSPARVDNKSDIIRQNISSVRQFNDLLSQEGIQYASEVLIHATQCIQSLPRASNLLVTDVIPSLASSLCRVPFFIPKISGRFAMSLLPLLTHSVRVLDSLILPQYRFLSPCDAMKQGKWIIRATGSGSLAQGSTGECEEYVVTFSSLPGTTGDASGFIGEGVGTDGKSKNGLVTIIGIIRGLALNFVEEWTDGSGSATASLTGKTLNTILSASSCVIDARLSIDGAKFEGVYRNVQYGTSGYIAGIHLEEDGTASMQEDVSPSDKSHDLQKAFIKCEALLCLAIGHMADILGTRVAKYDIDDDTESVLPSKRDSQGMKRDDSFARMLSCPLLSGGFLDFDGSRTKQAIESIRQLYPLPHYAPHSSASKALRELVPRWEDVIYTPLTVSSTLNPRAPIKNLPEVYVGDAIDAYIAPRTGGFGSLASLCPKDYAAARCNIIAVLLVHSGLDSPHLSGSESVHSLGDDILDIWRAALRIMENGIRKTLGASSNDGRHGSRREQCISYCDLTNCVSDFLRGVQVQHNLSASEVISHMTSLYASIPSKEDLNYLIKEMEKASKRAVLRYVGLSSICSIFFGGRDANLGKIRTIAAIESGVLVLPRLLGRGLCPPKPASLSSVERFGVRASFGYGTAVGALKYVDLGGHYLSTLSGSGQQIQKCIQNCVHELFTNLGTLQLKFCGAVGDSETSSRQQISSESLTLSVLATCPITIRPTDIAGMVVASHLIRSLQLIIVGRRGALGSLDDDSENVNAKDPSSVVLLLQRAAERQTSKLILKASVAVLHVFSFQLAQNASPSIVSTEDINKSLVRLLLDELSYAISCVETVSQEDRKRASLHFAEKEWDAWCELCLPDDTGHRIGAAASGAEREGIYSGVTYFLTYGTGGLQSLPYSLSQSPLSQGLTSSSPSQSSGTEYVPVHLETPCDYLSQWLNILCAVAHSCSFISRMLQVEESYLAVLLRAVGLQCSSRDNKSQYEVVSLAELVNLPARYRVRILRLFRHLLLALEPQNELVRGIFLLAGEVYESAEKTGRDDDYAVSREAITVLRYLYSLCNHGWRKCIHRVMDDALVTPVEVGETDENRARSSLHFGVLAFLSGSPGRLAVGSHVLLKPAAAAALSSTLPSSSGSKSHGSSGGSGSGSAGIGSLTPHHVVGSGTEGVVAGLCRADAMGGIISSIDAKGGFCEVILVERQMVSLSDSSSVSKMPSINLKLASVQSEGRSASPAMSVRAIRSPLSDVVSAEEMPLLLDTSLPTEEVLFKLLPDAVVSLRADHSRREIASKNVVGCRGSRPRSSENNVDENAEETGVNNMIREVACTGSKASSEGENEKLFGLISAPFMTLRAATVLLSDKRLLSRYLANSSSRSCLAELLKLASCTASSQPSSSGEPDSLSALPSHEARYWHLSSMLCEVQSRAAFLSSIQNSHWEKKTIERDTENKNVENKDAGETLTPKTLTGGTAEGYTTPPATIGTTSSSTRSSGASVLGNSRIGSDDRQGTVSDTNRTVSGDTHPSTASSNADEEEEDEGATAAAAHMREAILAQMAELGLPRSWSELALRRTGGTLEAAVHFCLERGGDMERLLAEEREREMLQRMQGSSSSRRRGNRGDSVGASHLLRQLVEMGFPSRWCAEALAATGNNVDEALTWILTNGERLSAQDEGTEEDDGEDDDVDEDEDDDSEEDEGGTGETAAVGESEKVSERSTSGASASEIEPGTESAEEKPSGSLQEKDVLVANANSGVLTSSEQEVTNTTKKGWSGTVTPLRFISGRSNIDPHTLAISGLPTGGFSSVGTKGVLLTYGKWYYEAILESAGCLQIGWADGSFSGHCHADRGDGCGDGPSSWAYDGWRRYKWHDNATEWGCRWKEGDVIGCLVDMDSKLVSFTLNGQGEEIGMGVAFSGDGFRPCGGVYACVSFNRKEKLRLILGGEGSESFKYFPFDGYRGVGEAIFDAAAERDALLREEKILYPMSRLPAASRGTNNARRYLCDFSDGEHGHELFAWQHRYYGSDASVHLGAGRGGLSQSGRNHKSPSSGSGLLSDFSPSPCVSRRVSKWWSKSKPLCDKSFDTAFILSKIKRGYDETAQHIRSELQDECTAIGVLYGRKLVLHMILTMGSDFDPACFLPVSGDDDASKTPEEETELVTSRRMWSMVNNCASLRSAGWVGEAGSMAVAAEALGLGISSHDHHHGHNTPLWKGVTSGGNEDDAVLLPTGGITQFLSSVVMTSASGDSHSDIRDTSAYLAACAEASIGGDGGGGALMFMKSGLQSAVIRSKTFRDLLIAVVRRSVRLLAVIDYAGDDTAGPSGSGEDDDVERSSAGYDETSSTEGTTDDEADEEDDEPPDARLAAFLSGLLLSHPVQNSLPSSSMLSELFEAWSVGLLSASAPWRMICALTAAGILNICPEALPRTAQRFPTLARFYGRLESTVARRVWAERAAVPVCSRYVQSMIELLASCRRSLRLYRLPLNVDSFTSMSGRLAVDAATPLPLDADLGAIVYQENAPAPCNVSWEWEEGWTTSDAGWEVWTGSVDIMALDWKAPSRSAVRTLMDGGEGPPMLREGCTVMRGIDWSESGSGAVTGKEDGKDVYEVEKALRDKEKQELGEKEKQDQADSRPEEPDSPRSGSEQLDSEDHKASSPTEVPPEVLSSPEKEPASPSSARVPANDDRTCSREKDTSLGIEKKKKRKKMRNPKLPTGTVISIEPWDGIPGLGRKVRWHLTGMEGIYRYGGDGGRYDIAHVEVNEKRTRVKKRHPLPESAEQCAARYGFGLARRYSVLLRLRRQGSQISVDETDVEYQHEGILEWPDFGAGVRVDCVFHSDGAVTITERELLYGSKDSGWEARFGQSSFEPGTIMVMSPTHLSPSTASEEADLDASSSFLSQYEELLGSSSYLVKRLRNRADGGRLRVTSEMRLLRGRHSCTYSSPFEGLSHIHAPMPPPICFDRECHASSISLSRDGRTATCVTSDGRGTAFASVGFTKGIHYWEVKIEQADIGSVYIGVAEKPSGMPGSPSAGSSFGFESLPRLNRWHGWGFVNFRATYTAGTERVYGAHCHNGDTVGVLLDCDAGRISFFVDGVKYGEHILNDLGCAFENVSPFGFNADGCGSGGAGQGAPSGVEGGRGGRYPANGSVRPRALWPVVGVRNPGDRVTVSAKWMTSLGLDVSATLRNVLAVDEMFCKYERASESPGGYSESSRDEVKKRFTFPDWFVRECYFEYERWRSGRWLRACTRGSGPHPLSSFGLDVDLDTNPLACAAACASLGLKYVLLPGDRVVVKRSAGRMLELSEEAAVLGACQGRLWYRIVSQKTEGGSLMEGGGRAWFWDESEAVDDGLQLIGQGRGLGVVLPLLDRFKCTAKGGLRIVYVGGAVVRSDLEIFEGSHNIGTIPHGSVIPQKDILERRVNSCGVVRYRIKYEAIGTGWISSRIRGGKEEAIVEPIQKIEADVSDGECSDAEQTNQESAQLPNYSSPEDAAKVWFEAYSQQLKPPNQPKSSTFGPENSEWRVTDMDEFEDLLNSAVFDGLSVAESDSLLASTVGTIADFSPQGDAVDCPFAEIATALSFALKIHGMEGREEITESMTTDNIPGANQAAAAVLSSVKVLPSLKALLVRIAMLRALNRRARFALPWLSVRPAQEGSAILGGLSGNGASVERGGRSRDTSAMSTWVQAPSVASRIRSFREIIFSSVKRLVLDSIIDATTTPTPLSHDEYELPREVRTVRVNRLKAARAMASNDALAKKKYSVFSQLQNEMRGYSGAALRRGFVAKGHGGQKRAFKVKLIGEGVNDYSGPYREVFTDAMREVMELDNKGRSALCVLEPSPNNASGIGENRDLLVFSSGSCGVKKQGGFLGSIIDSASDVLTEEEYTIRDSFTSLIIERDENSREVEEALLFLGRLVGLACRHGIPVDLSLPLKLVWDALVEEKTSPVELLNEIDQLACRQLQGKQGFLTSSFLACQQRMLNSFAEGIAHVLPVEIFSLFSGVELRDIICGNPDVDVQLLRRVVEYEGYEENDKVIRNFWEALREMTNRERKLFLQFVWARSRLPMKESDFDAPFKIQRDAKSGREDANLALPSASTCFFSLSLPEYSNKEILKRKLLFVIENVCTMESDYVTNDAEVGEGWRGL